MQYWIWDWTSVNWWIFLMKTFSTCICRTWIQIDVLNSLLEKFFLCWGWLSEWVLTMIDSCYDQNLWWKHRHMADVPKWKSGHFQLHPTLTWPYFEGYVSVAISRAGRVRPIILLKGPTLIGSISPVPMAGFNLSVYQCARWSLRICDTVI